MSMEAARAEFTSRFTTAWAADYPTIPVAYQNRKFSRPTTGPWAEFRVIETSRTRKNIGTIQSRFVRVTGLISIEIFVPEDSGTKALFDMLSKASLYLEEQSIPLSTGRSVTTLVAKRSSDGKVNGTERGTILIPYWLDEYIPTP